MQEVTATDDGEISVVVNHLQPSDSLQCVTVNAVDSGERVGPDSTLTCWLLNGKPGKT